MMKPSAETPHAGARHDIRGCGQILPQDFPHARQVRRAAQAAVKKMAEAEIGGKVSRIAVEAAPADLGPIKGFEVLGKREGALKILFRGWF